MKYLNLLPLFILSVASFANPIDELTKRLEAQQSLTGQFEQLSYDLDGRVVAESSGVYEAQKPNQLRWETTAPWAQLLVVNDRTVWLYDPDFEQATYSTFHHGLEASPAVLLSGDSSALSGAYQVDLIDGEYLLTPHEDNSNYKSLKVAFSDDLISAIEFVDFSGQRTEIRFSGVKAVPAIDRVRFEFTPPEGTEVVINE